MSAGNQSTAANGAVALAVAGATEETRERSLLDSAPEIAPSPEFFARFHKLINHQGPVRTEISDADWLVLLAALKGAAPRFNEYSDEPVDFVGRALLSIQHTRPVEQLFHDFCAAAGYTLDREWWHENKDKVPTTDYRDAFHCAWIFGEWSALSDPPKIPASRFTPIVPDLHAPRPRWIIKGIVPEKSMAMIYGRHGTGKSTLAIEMGVNVALGTPWHGRKVRQGTVVYVASENAHGFRARLDALLRDKGISLDALDGRLLELTSRPHLLKPEELTELIAQLRLINPSCVIFDTLARAAAGADENSAQEMGVMVENCQTLINQTDATVILLHHTGKDTSKGARGSSAIPGAVDAEIYLERPDESENLRVAQVGKMRDGPDYYALFRYTLDTVQLGTDEDGDKITSTVVRELPPDPVAVRQVTKLPNTPVRCAIRAALGESQRAVPFEELIAAAKERLARPDPGEADRRRDRIKATFERMVADREIYIAANGDVSAMDPAMPFTPVQADENSDLTEGGAE